MAFKKGEPRPPGAGRKKGSLNKATLEFRKLGAPMTLDWLRKLDYMIKTTKDDNLRTRCIGVGLRYLLPKPLAVQDHLEVIDAAKESGGVSEILRYMDIVKQHGGEEALRKKLEDS